MRLCFLILTLNADRQVQSSCISLELLSRKSDESYSDAESEQYEIIPYTAMCEIIKDIVDSVKLPFEMKQQIQAMRTDSSNNNYTPITNESIGHSNVVLVLSKKYLI